MSKAQRAKIKKSEEKPKTCYECGAVLGEHDCKTRCLACVMKAMDENIQQMIAKKGPNYDRYVYAMKAYAKRLK